MAGRTPEGRGNNSYSSLVEISTALVSSSIAGAWDGFLRCGGLVDGMVDFYAGLSRGRKLPVLNRLIYFQNQKERFFSIPLEEFTIDTGLNYSSIASPEIDMAVALITLDFNPLHTDKEYGKRTIFGSTIHHGVTTLLGLVHAANSMYSYQLNRIGLTGFKIDFRGPVRNNDLVTTDLVVVKSMNPDKIVEFTGGVQGPAGGVAVLREVKIGQQGLLVPSYQPQLDGERLEESGENILVFRKPSVRDGVAGVRGDYEKEIDHPLTLQPGSSFSLQRKLTSTLERRLIELTNSSSWSWFGVGMVSAMLALLGGQDGLKATIIFSSLSAENINDQAVQVGDALTARLSLLEIDEKKRLQFSYSVRNQIGNLLVEGMARVMAAPLAKEVVSSIGLAA